MKALPTAAALLLLVACTPVAEPAAEAPSPEDTALRAALAGRTLVHGVAELHLAGDGGLSGVNRDGLAVEGSWRVEDGRLCRTYTAPRVAMGSFCEGLAIADGAARLTWQDGSTHTYQIR